MVFREVLRNASKIFQALAKAVQNLYLTQLIVLLTSQSVDRSNRQECSESSTLRAALSRLFFSSSTEPNDPLSCTGDAAFSSGSATIVSSAWEREKEPWRTRNNGALLLVGLVWLLCDADWVEFLKVFVLIKWLLPFFSLEEEDLVFFGGERERALFCRLCFLALLED